MIITYRNPLQLSDTIDVYFDIPSNDFNDRWIKELKSLLTKPYHLEKNYCFMGFVDTPRNVEYLCIKINEAILQINIFNDTNKWEKAGLKPYRIEDLFYKDSVMYPESLPMGNTSDGDEMSKPGARLKHDTMNRLHRYFEDLQGEAWGLSQYYKIADYETKYAIRQLNDLCHELESYVLSYRKSIVDPQWQRPSQIMTFLQAPRINLQEKDYELFQTNKFDRECGGVYLHWAQIGKTHIEVFRDENGADVDDVICSSINSLKYYTGEFDIEWAKDVTESTAPWHAKEQESFYKWLERNNFDHNDSKLALGFIKISQCNLMKSFGTTDPQEIWHTLSKYQDVHMIDIDGVMGIFPYVWSQPNYAQMQISKMIPGYIYSSKET